MDFSKTPFGVPNSVQDSARINDMLKRSLAYQKMFSVSNACGFINVILKHCFEAAGIKVNTVYGTTKIMGIRVPHVWSTVEGHVVDNTYIEDFSEELFVAVKKSQVLSATLDGDTPLFLGDQETKALGIDNHDMVTFKYILENQNKALVMHKNRKSLRLYYQSMVTMMKKKFDVVVPDVPNIKCWSCGVEGMELKECSKCKFARYCSKNCQKIDWKFVHKNVCLPPEPY